MTSQLRSLGVVVLSLTALVGCGGGSEKGARSAADESAEHSGHAEVGKPAPALSLESLNGHGSISLDGMRGKVVIVDFWATWCGPCKQSFPKLEELSKRVGDKVEVVGISVDDEEKGVAEFAKENGVTFAIGWDEGHVIASRWKVGTMPTTFIVDGAGVVRYIHDGYHDGETKVMEKEVATLLDDRSSSERLAKSSSEPSGGDVADEPKSDVEEPPSEETASADAEEKTAPAAAPKPKKKNGKKAARGGKGGTKKQAKKKKKR